MPKAWGQVVYGLWSICAQISWFSTRPLTRILGLGKTHYFLPALSKFCTQFSHTKSKLSTPVFTQFFALSTGPIITITIK